MAKIVADGRFGGIKHHVEVDMAGGSPRIEVDYEYLPGVQSRFDMMIENPPALAGTYFPEPASALAVLAVLQGGYFDEPITCRVTGDIGEIPQPAGGGAVY